MTSRERILRVLNHKIPDRVPIHDVVWDSTIKRWQKEGLPEDLSPAEFFDFEIATFNADLTPRFPVKILEKNEEFIISTTPFGGQRKNYRDYSTTPEIIDWPIKSKEDWKEIKKRLAPDMTRINWAAGLQANKTSYEAGKFLCFDCATGYDALQYYMKSEQILIAMAEDPDWIKEMLTTLSELAVVTADLMLNNGFKFDALFNYNDMGYRNGLLFSPETYKKTHYDADLLLYEYFHSKGMKTILHSCGDVTEIIPTLIEVGLDCIQPLEVKSGINMLALKEKFGDRLSFMGGIDVRVMSDSDPKKIEEEIKRKFEIVKSNGGYIYHSDHSIPKNVSFQQYCRVIELVKQYGVYPEYEKILAEEKLQPEEDTSGTSKKDVKKKRQKRERKSKKPSTKVPEKVAQPKAPAKNGALVADKNGDKPEKPEQKKFKLPFGKKK
ncbi:hypothetical protein M0P98_03710 [bacterium]|nr:hypothetical protein [bacterium]